MPHTSQGLCPYRLLSKLRVGTSTCPIEQVLPAGIIDGYDKQEWDTNTDKCVFDWIISRYKNIKGFQNLCSYDDLHEIFTDGKTDIIL